MPLVTHEKQGAVAIITPNRPEKLNAMNLQLLADLRAAYEELERDEQAQTGGGLDSICSVCSPCSGAAAAAGLVRINVALT